jgi:hypothetical protein
MRRRYAIELPLRGPVRAHGSARDHLAAARHALNGAHPLMEARALSPLDRLVIRQVCTILMQRCCLVNMV